ncbi:MAG: hypothetical protein K1X53_05230 [Candidatus Sumerlaeaceae bacterium]|nr:hypothetical protein [Candidatus Sumerlaeaceae bacterium]
MTTPTLADFSANQVIRGPYARIGVKYPGVYRITGRDLESAGVDLSGIVPSRLTLWNRGEQVRILVKAPTTPVMRPDDYIEFIGDIPRGSFSTALPGNLYNIYFLSWGDGNPLRYEERTIVSGEDDLTTAAFHFRGHVEQDQRFFYLNVPLGTTDGFFWIGYYAGHEEANKVSLEFPGFDRRYADHVDLNFRLFGQSNVPGLKPGHKFSAFYGDEPIGTAVFDGMQYFDFETTVPASLIAPGKQVTFRAPKDREGVVDSILLDWVNVRYPRQLDAARKDEFWFTSDLLDRTLPQTFPLRGTKPGARVYSIQEGLVYLPASRHAESVTIQTLDTPTSYVAVTDNGVAPVEFIHSRPMGTRLSEVAKDAELLVVFHPRVARAAKLYADYRKAEGLRVTMVSVDDVFDTFSDGLITDHALKLYIRWVGQNARGLRYLTLFGDSSFDYRESQNLDDESPPQTLIPIHWVVSPSTPGTGGYADDNWYGAFGRGNKPNIAVGRIPANDDDEGMAYIRKLIEYEQLGLSRNDKALMLSSVEKSFQELVFEARNKMADGFTTVTTLFPETNQADREVQKLRDEITSGIQILYYVGHGGSFVWRVGPTDYKQQKDLFTPADVGKLDNHGHYPIVVASSCYTTSFNEVESLGEALIMAPDKGAIAVLGTPWKATVYESHSFNIKLLEYYLDKTFKRLGDVFLASKKTLRTNQDEIAEFQTFTLIGDPCLRLERSR